MPFDVKNIFFQAASPIPVAKIKVFHGVHGLRCFATLLVVICHSSFYASERLVPGSHFWEWIGRGAVDIFFVMSGFVVYLKASTLLDKVDGWQEFVIRRTTRVIPLYWLATTIKLLFLFGAPAVVFHAAFSYEYVVRSYFFIPAYNIDGIVSPLLGVGWTLYFEMFFYSLICGALYLKFDPIKVVGIVFGTCAILSLARKAGWPAFSIYFDPIILEFLFGMLIGKLVILDKLLKPYIAGIILIVGFSILFSGLGQMVKSAAPIIFGATAVLYSIVSLERRIGNKIPRLMSYLADASYPIYLFHPLIAPLAPTLLAIAALQSMYLSVICSVSLALLTGSLIHSFLEIPFNKWLDKWLKGKPVNRPLHVTT